MKVIRAYFTEVLSQLFTNAHKFSSPSRELLLRLLVSEQDEQLMLHISDNGIGIDLKSFKDKIFGPYQRFHLHKEGRGVGLYICKAKMMAMGGEITVSSEPERGTTFTLHFSSYTNDTSVGRPSMPVVS